MEDLAPGTYQLRAIARAGSERALAAVTLTIPEDAETCTVHLINRGVTVSGDTATIEFGGFGRGTGYSCRLDNGPSTPCENVYTYMYMYIAFAIVAIAGHVHSFYPCKDHNGIGFLRSSPKK